MKTHPHQTQMSRRNVILTGLVGLIGAVILTALCLFVVVLAWIPVLVRDRSLMWIILLFLLTFSLTEIPVMIFGIRRIAASVNPKAKYVALFTNAGYTFFGAVYAAPFILLTGELILGTALAGLSFVRFMSAVIFIPR